jgi:hypothetical protein
VISEPGVSRHYAVADGHQNGTFMLVVRRRSDDHEVWGDVLLPARRWADIPAAATARLARSDYQVTSEWREVQPPDIDGPTLGPSWQADAAVVSEMPRPSWVRPPD